MRKSLLTIGLILMLSMPVHAQQARGVLTNVYASWVTATTTQTTLTFPFTSRDLLLINGSTSQPVCIDIFGGTIPANCATNSTTVPRIFQLAASNGTVKLSDFKTTSVSFKTITGSASPITVISTY